MGGFLGKVDGVGFGKGGGEGFGKGGGGRGGLKFLRRRGVWIHPDPP